MVAVEEAAPAARDVILNVGATEVETDVFTLLSGALAEQSMTWAINAPVRSRIKQKTHMFDFNWFLNARVSDVLLTGSIKVQSLYLSEEISHVEQNRGIKSYTIKSIKISLAWPVYLFFRRRSGFKLMPTNKTKFSVHRKKRGTFRALT